MLVNHAFIARKYLYLLEWNIIHHNLDDHIPTRDLKRHNLVYHIRSVPYTWGRALEPSKLLLNPLGDVGRGSHRAVGLGNRTVWLLLKSAVEAEWEQMMRTLRVTEIELCENNVWDVTLTILETDREDVTVLSTHHCHKARQFCNQKTSSSLAHITS